MKRIMIFSLTPMVVIFVVLFIIIASVSSMTGSGSFLPPEPTKEEALGINSSVMGAEIVAYARQFIGNPYVWGGTSLTNGADCSGFVQSVFAHFGIKLPRTASEQSRAGVEVASLDDMVIGDIITYHSGSSASGWHVGIYDGAGNIVEAQGSRYGITNNRPANRGKIVSIRRFVSDVVSNIDTNALTGEKGEYLGQFKLTGYCPCVRCCGKWAGGPTASGVMPTANRTVAISKSTAKRFNLSFGDKLIIDGVLYVYEDGGDSNMDGNNWIDIFVATHPEAYAPNINKKAAEVYRAK
jgi:Cell wall-associated hydrolases (invasion-associated proteins)